MECVCSLIEEIPVTEEWHIVLELTDQVLANDSNAHTGWSDVLLSTCIHHTELAPVNWPRGEVGAHITDEDLVFGDLVEWEVVELKALDGLIVAIMEVRCAVGDLPLFSFRDPCITIWDVGGDLSDLVASALLGLLDGSLRP